MSTSELPTSETANACRGIPGAAAGDLHRRHFRQRRAAVRGAADVHQDGAAAARRRRVGVVGGDGVLPDHAARRLCLCASADALRARPQLHHHSSRRHGGRVLRCCRCISRADGDARRRSARRSGCSGCSPYRSDCRSSRSPPTVRCCRPGSCAPATRTRKDPYFLYAASNVGSFLALIAYPVAVEPFVRLGDQTWLWTVGYYALIALVAGCGFLMLRSPNRLPEATPSEPPPRRRRRPGATPRSGSRWRRCRPAC